jgi:probable F420-dependent oxidoreductase
MQIGVVYSQTELPTDSNSVRAYVKGVEQLGYRHLVVFDHVLGADPAVHKNWDGPYDIGDTFHEPFVLYGFLAAITQLELVTAVIVAPQRQTALLAKQAAEVDILSEGRFRLGLGVGWNAMEYEALGQDFTTRGRREEEQIQLLRRLWTEPSVTYEGVFDRVTGAGLAPLPVQRPIPIWLGGEAPAAQRRIGRFADGWFPQMVPGRGLAEAQQVIADVATSVGRDPGALGMEGQVKWGSGGIGVIVEHAERWSAAGATHLAVNTMGSGLSGVDAHLEVLSIVAAALGLASAVA